MTIVGKYELTATTATGDEVWWRHLPIREWRIYVRSASASHKNVDRQLNGTQERRKGSAVPCPVLPPKKQLLTNRYISAMSSQGFANFAILLHSIYFGFCKIYIFICTYMFLSRSRYRTPYVTICRCTTALWGSKTRAPASHPGGCSTRRPSPASLCAAVPLPWRRPGTRSGAAGPRSGWRHCVRRAWWASTMPRPRPAAASARGWITFPRVRSTGNYQLRWVNSRIY